MNHGALRGRQWTVSDLSAVSTVSSPLVWPSSGVSQWGSAENSDQSKIPLWSVLSWTGDMLYRSLGERRQEMRKVQWWDEPPETPKYKCKLSEYKGKRNSIQLLKRRARTSRSSHPFYVTRFVCLTRQACWWLLISPLTRSFRCCHLSHASFSELCLGYCDFEGFACHQLYLKSIDAPPTGWPPGSLTCQDSVHFLFIYGYRI